MKMGKIRYKNWNVLLFGRHDDVKALRVNYYLLLWYDTRCRVGGRLVSGDAILQVGVHL